MTGTANFWLFFRTSIAMVYVYVEIYFIRTIIDRRSKCETNYRTLLDGEACDVNKLCTDPRACENCVSNNYVFKPNGNGAMMCSQSKKPDRLEVCSDWQKTYYQASATWSLFGLAGAVESDVKTMGQSIGSITASITASVSGCGGKGPLCTRAKQNKCEYSYCLLTNSEKTQLYFKKDSTRTAQRCSAHYAMYNAAKNASPRTIEQELCVQFHENDDCDYCKAHKPADKPKLSDTISRMQGRLKKADDSIMDRFA